MNGSILVPTLFTLLGSVVLLAHMLWLGATGDSRAPELPSEERKRHYVWGLFYVNPADPRGWVPKTLGVGVTVNFRTKTQVYVFVLLLVLTLAGSLWMTSLAL